MTVLPADLAFTIFAYTLNQRQYQSIVIAGNLKLLKKLHTRGVFFSNERIAAMAARGGHLDCLRYLHEQGCPWDKYTCSEAARGGHLDCLKYAHEQGCPWDDGVIAGAASLQHLDCLNYAMESRCPFDIEKSLVYVNGSYQFFIRN